MRISEASKRAMNREKARDFDAYKLRKRTEQQAYCKANKEKVLKAAGVRARAFASKRPLCDVCQSAWACQATLDKHYKSKLHQLKAQHAQNGTVPPPRSQVATKAKERRDKAQGVGQISLRVLRH